MALIKCPERGNSVSDKAKSYPKCAYPILEGSSPLSQDGKIQTIEQTSKQQQLLATILVIASFVLIVVGLLSGVVVVGVLGFVGLLICLIWLVIARIMAWWHHG